MLMIIYYVTCTTCCLKKRIDMYVTLAKNNIILKTIKMLKTCIKTYVTYL